MAYYLVKQTLLIEADNEKHAAEKIIERTLQAPRLDYKVKLDEDMSWHVSITAQRRDEIVRTVSLGGIPQMVAKPFTVEEDLEGTQFPQAVQGRSEQFPGRLMIPGGLIVLSVLLVANLVAVLYV